MYEHTESEQRLRRALGNFPWSSSQQIRFITDLIGFDRDRTPEPMDNDTTIGLIADFLEEISRELHEYIDQNEGTARDYSELHRALAVVGSALRGTY